MSKLYLSDEVKDDFRILRKEIYQLSKSKNISNAYVRRIRKHLNILKTVPLAGTGFNGEFPFETDFRKFIAEHKIFIYQYDKTNDMVKIYKMYDEKEDVIAKAKLRIEQRSFK
jgi:hypothetical protein